MKGFSLLIKPAGADCNLACNYCFYRSKSHLYPPSPRINDVVLEGIISSYMATQQAVYAFGWQGGEPTLMGADFFTKVTDLQQKHGKPGAEVSNSLQTNGLLVTRDLARHLAKYNFLTGISLDGPAEMHDKYRRSSGKGGSHSGVIRAAEIMRGEGAEFNILTLVSSANVSDGKMVYEYLRDSGFLHHQYIPCVEFGPDGQPEPWTISGEQWGEFLCSVFDAWIAGDTRRVSVRLFDSMMNLFATGKRDQCTMMDDCRQYFLVEHNGDVYPCDFFVEPKWKLGNIMNDGWEAMAQSEVFRRFGRQKAERNEACASCPALDICKGDCQKNRRGEGGSSTGLSWLCSGWRRFYEHAGGELARIAGDIGMRGSLKNAS